jgi:hypothetical protein
MRGLRPSAASLLAATALTVLTGLACAGCDQAVSGSAIAAPGTSAAPKTSATNGSGGSDGAGGSGSGPDAATVCAQIPKSAVEQAFHASDVTISVLGSNTQSADGVQVITIQCTALTSNGQRIVLQRQSYPSPVTAEEVVRLIPQAISGSTNVQQLNNIGQATAAASFQSPANGVTVDSAIAAQAGSSGGTAAIVVSCRDGNGVMNEVIALLTSLSS